MSARATPINAAATPVFLPQSRLDGDAAQTALTAVIAGAVVLVGLSPLKDVHAVYVGLLPIALLYFVAAPSSARKYLLRPSILAFGAFLVVGLLWSEQPGQTLNGLGTLLFESVAGVAVAALPSPRQAGRAVTGVIRLFIIVSFLWAILLPSHGRMLLESGHPWRGIFVHKNALGVFAAFSCVILNSLLERRRRLWIGLCLLLLALAVSRGPLAAATAGLGAQFLAGRLYFARGTTKRAYPRWVFVGAIAIVGLAVNESAGAIIALLGKTANLSHRTSVWSLVISYAHSHWWFGSGLNAQIYPGSTLWYELQSATQQSLGTTQDGYLAILLAGGIVGCALFAMVLVGIAKSIDRYRNAVALRTECGLAIGCLAVYCVCMFSEDIALSRAGWFFLTFGIARLFASARGPDTVPHDQTK